jgi:hypothetical protein
LGALGVVRTKPGFTARVKQSANSKPKPQARSWFSDARAFVRRPDVSSLQLGEFCNLFTLEVAGRAASDLEVKVARSAV